MALRSFVVWFSMGSLVACGGGGSTEVGARDGGVRADGPQADAEVVDADTSTLHDVALTARVTAVQPMTGIALWEENDVDVKTEPGVVQLEYAYVPPGSIAVDDGVYVWDAFDAFLDRIAGRGHQAIVRFYDTYPGAPTAVPEWIKALPDYRETSGQSEGQPTRFPDWSSEVLQQFYLDFYAAFAARYDADPRIVFLQVGFGLWGEYHIYDGPNELGRQFPSKAYQQTFLAHLDDVLPTLAWSVSIDAGSDDYGPFVDTPALIDLGFGLFDDSFMIETHAGYNAEMWTFFDHTTRVLRAPAGGELSYASDFDQQHALDVDGIHGRTYEDLSARYGISYMVGNDQPDHQSAERIRAAGLANGYRFRVTRFATNATRSEVAVQNTGIAPIYYDAFVAIDGVRSTTSLRGLAPGATVTCDVPRGGDGTTLTIDSDRLVPGQVIGFDADL